MLKDNLKNLRKAKGWSQEELAIKLNVVRQTISKWENGSSVPDSEMLIKIAEELDTSVNILLGKTISDNEGQCENREIEAIVEKLEILNEQFTKRCERQRKRWRAVFTILGIMVAIFLIYKLLDFFYYQEVLDGILNDPMVIGGFDGATNIYVSNIPQEALSWIIALTVAVISIVGIRKTRRR